MKQTVVSVVFADTVHGGYLVAASNATQAAQVKRSQFLLCPPCRFASFGPKCFLAFFKKLLTLNPFVILPVVASCSCIWVLAYGSA